MGYFPWKFSPFLEQQIQFFLWPKVSLMSDGQVGIHKPRQHNPISKQANQGNSFKQRSINYKTDISKVCILFPI